MYVCVTCVGVLGASLLRPSCHAADALLLVDGHPEGLSNLAVLQTLDHLEGGVEEAKEGEGAVSDIIIIRTISSLTLSFS